MAYEDFTTFTEVDPNGRISVDDASNITCTNLLRESVAAYVYKDYTATHFATGLTHEFEIRCSSTGTYAAAGVWALSNDLSEMYEWASFSREAAVAFLYGNFSLFLRDSENGTGDQDNAGISISTRYYCRVSWSSNTLTLYIYTDAARTSLHDSVTVTLAAGRTYRYCYAVVNNDDTKSTSSINFEVDNLDLKELTLADDSYENTSPYDNAESIGTVAATGGVTPYSYAIIDQRLV